MRVMEENAGITSDLLAAVARALDLSAEQDLRVERTLPTHVRSEVVAIATPGGRHLIAKQFLDGEAQLRFEAEHTTLSTLAGSLAPIPALRGADSERLVLIVDAIDGPTVEEVLRGGAPGGADRWLVAYARAMGILHSAAAGAVAAIRRVREERGHTESSFWPPFARDVRASAEKLAAFSETPADELAREMAEIVQRTYEAPGADGTLIQWDSWPGNAIAGRDKVVIVDLENSMNGSGLIDVSSWHLAFPAAPLRAPFAGPIPDRLIKQMDGAYEQARGRRTNAANLAFAVACRMLFELTAPSVRRLASGTLDDRIRALYAFRLERAASVLRRAGVLPVLTDAMQSVAAKAKPTTASGDHLQPYAAVRD